MSKSRTCLTLEKQREVIRGCDSGKSSRILAVEYGVGRTQILNIIKRRDAILKDTPGLPLSSKRKHRETGNEPVNELMFEWFNDAKRRKVHITGPMMSEQALHFAHDLGIPDFKASNGWRDTFKKRHTLVFGKSCGEAGDVDPTTVDDWKVRLAAAVEGYEERDIFNMDESGLYFKTSGDKTFYVKGQKNEGGKKSKERITASFCANLCGEKEPVLLIGKSARPRAFGRIDINTLPCTYRFSRKAWMTTDLFVTWLTSFNAKMMRQDRHVLLFLDNAPSHPKTEFSNVKLMFFPPNTTSKLQPLDQGVIQAFKLKYRKRQMTHILAQLRSNPNVTGPEIMKKVTVLDAVMWAAEAWKEVAPETITKCFRHAGFKSADQQTDDIALIEPVNEELNSISRELIGVDFGELHQIDEDIETCDNVDIDWSRPKSDILSELRGSSPMPEEEEEDGEDEQTTSTVTPAEALKALCIIKEFASSHAMLEEMTVADKLADKFLSMLPNMTKQKTINDFFTKK